MVSFKDFMFGDDQVIDETLKETQNLREDSTPKEKEQTPSTSAFNAYDEMLIRAELLNIKLERTSSNYTPTPSSSHGHRAPAPGQAKGGVKGI